MSKLPPPLSNTKFCCKCKQAKNMGGGKWIKFQKPTSLWMCRDCRAQQ